ncbi:ABC transporter ATP-binding protein [Patescibacteria group bacterium]|nr:MAG: ABC transporter ATP-binding protein [Patescibacteria group bacterium]
MADAIKVAKVTKAFGAKKALDNVSLSVPTGKIFGFLGPNGAGKTTLIRCMMDYINTTSGQITLLGQDAQADSAQVKRSIGYPSSDMQLHDNWSAQTHIDFLSSIKGRGRADELVQQFGLDTKPKVRHLSSGNKQKLAVILAFLGDPKLLIMDEPTRGLDPLLQNQLYELLRDFAAGGGTVFLSSHNLSEVQQLCDSVAVIREGKIVAAEAMKDILQLRVHIVQATTTKTINPKDFELKDVEVIGGDKNTISLKVRGKIDPVLAALTKYNISALEVSHANLEDVFMEYY